MFDLDAEKAEKMLSSLGDILEDQNVGPFDIVVCGSMAMILQGLIDRRTTDIDIIGLLKESDGDVRIEMQALERAFLDARQRVATFFDAPKTWLSVQARTLLQNGLPEDLVERAEVRSYGRMLNILLPCRLDLVTLKMWGAVGRGQPDIEDLIEMEPTVEEVECGIAFCLEKGTDRKKLSDVLKEIGHGDLAKRLD